MSSVTETRPGVPFRGVVLSLLSLLLVATVVVSASMGSAPIEYAQVGVILLDALLSSAVDFLPLSSNPLPRFYHGPPKYEVIVTQIRMPRIAVGAVVGFSLASAGTVMQGFFRNPLADPSVIGVSSGAAVGAVASIAVPSLLPLGLGLQGAAFVGAVVTAFGVYALATKEGRTSVATLLLAGVAVQTFLGAVVSFLLYISGESLREAVYWLMGNLTARDWSHFVSALPVVLVCFAVLLFYARDLNVLLLGEEEAETIGVEVERTKRILLAVSSVMTAAAVAVSGVIGFVGIIVPHTLRLVVGTDHRILLPASALGGASFLVATDSIARTLLGGAELPVGIVTAFLGVPFFLYLLRQQGAYEL